MAGEKKPDVWSVWGYGSSEREEAWQGMENSREEAIKEGRAHYGKEEGFWIIWGTKQEAKSFVPDADWVIEDMGQRASDELGEVSEDWPHVSDEAKEELNKLLEAWAEKNITCNMWLADGVAEYIPPEVPSAG